MTLHCVHGSTRLSGASSSHRDAPAAPGTQRRLGPANGAGAGGALHLLNPPPPRHHRPDVRRAFHTLQGPLRHAGCLLPAAASVPEGPSGLEQQDLKGVTPARWTDGTENSADRPRPRGAHVESGPDPHSEKVGTRRSLGGKKPAGPGCRRAQGAGVPSWNCGDTGRGLPAGPAEPDPYYLP